MLFKDRLIRLRKSYKLTQQEMAKKIGVHRGTYSNYESGKRQPDYDTLQKIADVFDVTIDHLLGRTDNSSPTRTNEIEDPELGLWFKELKDAPEEKREELRQIWEIIKQREAGRKPEDKQGE